ncbi:hypothetical protein BKA70DRAFT_1370214 [Coprinopsis sp. MPI-PUGE-AT-0042]|nr:hypothetical protein BKA70DRAFT_1370214 [Coprinopsis sp. MPI-PUGE-AT-0042]
MPALSTHKFIIQMSGAPGSGKSTLASLLGHATGAVVIDHDQLRSVPLEPPFLLPFDQAAQLAYAAQWRLLHDLVRQGHSRAPNWTGPRVYHSVIVDCTCNSREVVDTGSRCAAEAEGYAYWYVECRTDPDVDGDLEMLDARLRDRKALPSQRTGVDAPPMRAVGGGEQDQRAIFRRWMAEPCRPEEEGVVIVLDASEKPEKLRDRVLEKILG